MITAILFDLDDTLYDEWTYVRSGFAQVAATLAPLHGGTPDDIVATLLEFHRSDRAGVFQRFAAKLALPTELIPAWVDLMRGHTPAIALPQDTRAALPRLRHTYRLGCVTDGWAPVQRRKLAALGLPPLLDAIVVCDDMGRECWKPSPLPFQRCCALLGVAPREAVFVGDHPGRDWLGAQAAGLDFVRIRRPGGYFAGEPMPVGSAVSEVHDLLELEQLLGARTPRPAAVQD